MTALKVKTGLLAAALLASAPSDFAMAQSSSDPSTRDIIEFLDPELNKKIKDFQEKYPIFKGSDSPANLEPPPPPSEEPSDLAEPFTPYRGSSDGKEEAAAQQEVKRKGQMLVAERNAGYRSELVAIRTEDASTLRFLSTDCTNNDAPNANCMNAVGRARRLDQRMQALLLKPGAADYLSKTLNSTWRPESPTRAAAVKMPLEPGSGGQPAREYVRKNSLRDSDGGFLGCRDKRTALIADQGSARAAEEVENYAAFNWDMETLVREIAAHQEPRSPNTPVNAYRVCVLRARWAELYLNTRNPPPQTSNSTPARSELVRGNDAKSSAKARPNAVSDDYAAGLFQQSVSEAKGDPSAAQRLASNNQRRLEEVNQLTNSLVERSQRNAANVLSVGSSMITAMANANSPYPTSTSALSALSPDAANQALPSARNVAAVRRPGSLVISGPPWPCASEMAAWRNAAPNFGGTVDDYWRSRDNSPAMILLDMNAFRGKYDLHRQYEASVPGARSGPVFFNESSFLWRENFFRNRLYMERLAAFWDAERRRPGLGHLGAQMLVHACIARHLAANATE